MKPVLAAALATGAAGVAAFASPLAPVRVPAEAQPPGTPQARGATEVPRAKVKATVRFLLPQPVIMSEPLAREPRPGLRVHVSEPVAPTELHPISSESAIGDVASAVQPSSSAMLDLEPLARSGSGETVGTPAAAMVPLPRDVQTGLAPSSRTTSLEQLAGPHGPATGHQAAAAMPAAELKAMMGAVSASRQESEAVVDSERFSVPQSPVSSGRELGEEQAATSTVTKAQASLRTGESQQAIGRYSQTDRGIEFEVTTIVNGGRAGRVPLLIADGENISVRLGDVLALLEPVMDKSVYDALSTAKGAGEYVTFNTLRERGIAVRFDSDDRLVLGVS